MSDFAASFRAFALPDREQARERPSPAELLRRAALERGLEAARIGGRS